MDKSIVTAASVADSQHHEAESDPDKAIYSDTLFATGNEVLIQHHGEQYRLRRTRNGKLILTK